MNSSFSARQDEIVPFFEQWNEIEMMLMRGGLDTQGDIGLARFNHRGGLAVRLDDLIVAPDLISHSSSDV